MKKGLSNEDVNIIFDMITLFINTHKDKFEIWDINYTDNNVPNSVHCPHKYDNYFINFLVKKLD